MVVGNGKITVEPISEIVKLFGLNKKVFISPFPLCFLNSRAPFFAKE